MKQLFQVGRRGNLVVLDIPAPAAQTGYVRVQNAYSLISPGTETATIEAGRRSLLKRVLQHPELLLQLTASLQQQGLATTLQTVRSKLDRLTPLGYSCAGTVIDVGAGINGLRCGQRVACAGADYAHHAEIVAVPCNLCVPVPDSLPLDRAAFGMLGAIALQSVRIADVHLGEVIAVIGLGLVGQLTAQLLTAAGCRVIAMDLLANRSALVAELASAESTTSSEQMRTLCLDRTAGRGVDAVVICAATPSNEPIQLAGQLCREKGRVVVVGAVGMDVPRSTFYAKELDLRLSRSCGPGRYDPQYEEKGHDYPYGYVRWTEGRNMAGFLQLAASGRVRLDRLITHRFTIDDAPEAYHLITGPDRDATLGVLLEYPAAKGVPEVITALSLSPTIQPSNGARPVAAPGARAQSPVRIGFIGAGSFARSVLLPGLKGMDQVELRSVAANTGVSAGSAAKQFGFAMCTTDYHHILEDPQIDAVFIATRHNTHARMAIEALAAGKHIFVEKPLALNQDELNAITVAYRAAQERATRASVAVNSPLSPGSPPVIMVGFNRRFAPLSQAAHDFFAGRSFPIAVNIRVNSGSLPSDHWVHDPAIGGGRIRGEGCHFVDLACYLVGTQVERVWAEALQPVESREPDSLVLTLRFADGSIGAIQYFSMGDPGLAKEHVEIFGGGRVFVIDDFMRGRALKQGHTVRYGGLLARQDKGHAMELDALIRAVCGSGADPQSFTQSVHSTQVTLAIVESLQQGVPVQLVPEKQPL